MEEIVEEFYIGETKISICDKECVPETEVREILGDIMARSIGYVRPRPGEAGEKV